MRNGLSQWKFFAKKVIPVEETTEIFSINWSICVDPIRFFGVEKKTTGTFAVFVRRFSLKGKFHEICPFLRVR